METEDPATPSTPSRSPATVMIADMVGYSTRMEQNEELNARQAARSIELFKSLTGDYGGQVVNVSGDGILALFQEPRIAALCADDPLARRAAVTLADLAARPVVLCSTAATTDALWPAGPPAALEVANVDEWLTAIATGEVTSYNADWREFVPV